MNLTAGPAPVVETPTADGAPSRRGSMPGRSTAVRWAPFAAGAVAVSMMLLANGTSIIDLLRFAGYVCWALALPGTLLYRALRRTPHTFVEDVAMGLAVGLVLELAGWAVLSALDLQAFVRLWPLIVVVPFAAIPRLRQHWLVRDYSPTPLGWSWSVAGVVTFFTGYLWQVFLAPNPILPTSEGTRQYVDLPYQLSLAGAAKHQFPLELPQVAGEPLFYHWFGYVHMAMTSMIGGIDLPVVALRLAVPGLSIAAIVLTAVVGWRVSGRPYVGVGAAVLFWAVGEVGFSASLSQPFGTQVTFAVWHGMSMIYSWVLLLALIAVLAEITGRAAGNPVPALGRGAYVLALALMVASTGAKASSMPVVLLALAMTCVVLLVIGRRISWPVVAAGLLGGAAQLFAMAVVFRFQTYGLVVAPLNRISYFWFEDHPRSAWKQAAMVGGVFAAFAVNMQSRLAGVLGLAGRGRLAGAQWFLLSGAVAGPALFLTFGSINAGYFTRAGFTFGVLLSAWGYALVLDRARLSARGRALLAAGAITIAVILTLVQLATAEPTMGSRPFSPLVPIVQWSLALGVAGLIGAALWIVLRRWRPALRGRGPLVALTMVLIAGAPGLVMDAYAMRNAPAAGPNALPTTSLPASRVDAARWVRANSEPDDVLATNVHCLNGAGDTCDSRSFWLSAYAERAVMIEGWRFAPRLAGEYSTAVPFWDQPRLLLNDSAFEAPTADILSRLRDEHQVRYLVADRTAGSVSAQLATLADERYANDRITVYELR